MTKFTFPLFMSILMAVAGTIFVGLILYNLTIPNNEGILMLTVFPIMAYIGSAIWFKSWYDDRNKKIYGRDWHRTTKRGV